MPIIKPVSAHCDVPCGIYEVDTLKNAARTCLKLVQDIQVQAGCQCEDKDSQQQLIRTVMVKEEHASLCKQQIYILWSDFFKPADFKNNPDLHDQLWQATKACSAVKQSLKPEPAEKLVELVDGLVTVFEATKASRA